MEEKPHAEFVQLVHEGLYEEYQLVRFIMANLVHPSQLEWMVGEKLMIADLLNGRFNGEQEPTVQAIFLDWNLQLRDKLFKL